MRRVAMTLVLLFALSLGIGCSSNSKTVRTETVEYPAGQAERQTTTTKETHSDSSGGILSGTVNVIGEIIALPFRLVGGLFRIIF
ncbi:MAG: hypothetical protein ACRERD_02350 [Candidatus Binatia bacterium]